MKKLIFSLLVCSATIASAQFVQVTPSEEIKEKVRHADSTSSNFLIDIACAGRPINITPYYGGKTAFRIIQCDSVKSSLLRLDTRNEQWEIRMPSALLGEMETGILKITSFIADPTTNNVTMLFTKFGYDREQETYSVLAYYTGVIDERGHWLKVTQTNH